MGEQSHKSEMAAALRGDFARLRARGVATTLEPAVVAPTPMTDDPATSPPEPPSPTAGRVSSENGGAEIELDAPPAGFWRRRVLRAR